MAPIAGLLFFFFFWAGWVCKQQPVAAQLHSDPCRYSLGWAASALSDNTKVRRGICDETGFVEQERLTWPRVAVSDAVASKVPVSVSSSPLRLSAKKPPRDISPQKSRFLIRRKTADNLFWGADCFERSQVINNLKDAGESERQGKRQILGGFNWNNISHRGVVQFPSATAMVHFMAPSTLPFPTFPLWLYLPSTSLANQ